MVQIRPGCTRPCTAKPNRGSSERMVWPPATVPPASATTAAAPANTASIADVARPSGNPATLSASTTRPPMANTSEQALAAATAPKSPGSSTSGGKKSMVDTSAVSSFRR